MGFSPSGVGNGNSLQCSCLENFMDRGAQWAIVHEVAKNQNRLSRHSCLLSCARLWLAALNKRVVKGFPGVSNSKGSAARQETQVHSLGWEDPLEKGMVPTPEFLPGEFHRQRSLVSYRTWGYKESHTLSDSHTHTRASVVIVIFALRKMS